MAPHKLEDVLVEELRDLYSAEKQMAKALPAMARAASDERLQRAFEQHLSQTEGQIARLEEAFRAVGRAARAKRCVAMEGLIDEAREHLKQDLDPEVMDAVLAASAQKVEHYEIASYGTARTWAEQLGRKDLSRLLQETLEEEKQADLLLTELAERLLNPQAA